MGTTWIYDYDRGGNILSKKRYAYTTGTVCSILQTISYSYGDSNWKDKLTKYNGTTITYDAIGNPTNDGTWTYTWQNGRQLQQMSKTGTTASFVYNAEGLRVRKTVNSVVTNYTLHGKNIVHMTQGSNTLHFWYDAQNRPAIVQFNGTKYAYIHNLQGDIVGLIDTSGTEVVKYTYDAWGKPLSTTGSLASTLGTIQPFRYRGYVYDVETGIYYLRSRYYEPTWNRFLNADVIICGSIFAYCKANPIAYSDKNGTDATPSQINSCPEMEDIRTPFQRAQDIYNTLYPDRMLIRVLIKSSSEPTSYFVSSTHTYNWEARAAYDIAQAVTDISGEIGSFIDATFVAYGIPIQPGPYIDNGIQIVSSLTLPDTPPETHQYTIYRMKDEYKHSVDGYRYVSVEQEFYSCELPNCTIHNSGIVNFTLTTSNDVIPFYYGSTHSVTIHYNMPN